MEIRNAEGEGNGQIPDDLLYAAALRFLVVFPGALPAVVLLAVRPVAACEPAPAEAVEVVLAFFALACVAPVLAKPAAPDTVSSSLSITTTSAAGCCCCWLLRRLTPRPAGAVVCVAVAPGVPAFDADALTLALDAFI